MPDDVISPLVWDGSTLSIPRARSNQDGYLSRDTFVLLSGGGEIVPVTSFNTRTGEVVLLEDDVLAALGYVPQHSLGYTPLNKAGDTMTGMLTLAGPPTSDLHAATRAYVNASSGSAAPGIFNVILYGASGSKLTFTGAITTGSQTLTLTTGSHNFAVGQGITIVGAGNLPSIDPASNLLVSRITAISGATITIADAALHTVSNAVVKHDDTVAIQSAINAAATAKGGIVIFPLAYYRINGPFTAINSILRIPANPYNSPSIPIIFRAESPTGYLTYAGGTSDSGAVIIKTERVGGAMISGGFYENDSADWTTVNNTCVEMEGLLFRSYDNPQCHGIDLAACGQYTILRDTVVDTGTSLFAVTQPNVAVFGIRLPGNSTSILQECTGVAVYNYGVGIYASEICHFTNTIIMQCMVALRCVSGYHLLSGRFLIWHCPTVIEFTNTTSIPHVIKFDIDVEEATGAGTDPAWTVPAVNHSFYDPGNLAHGAIDYINVQGGTGIFQTVGFTGMTHVVQRNLGTLP